MLTPKQRKILDLAKNGEFTKQEAVALIGDNYNSAEKYVGEVLSRMVESGLIIRVRNGVFRLPLPPERCLTQIEMFL